MPRCGATVRRHATGPAIQCFISLAFFALLWQTGRPFSSSSIAVAVIARQTRTLCKTAIIVNYEHQYALFFISAGMKTMARRKNARSVVCKKQKSVIIPLHHAFVRYYPVNYRFVHALCSRGKVFKTATP